MRVFLDENLPHRLRIALRQHDVSTAAYMGWASIKNGKLLDLVEAEGFDVFVTADKQIKSQQNFNGRQISMIYLTAQEWNIISSKVSLIQAAVDGATPGSFHVVQCGEFRR